MPSEGAAPMPQLRPLASLARLTLLLSATVLEDAEVVRPLVPWLPAGLPCRGGSSLCLVAGSPSLIWTMLPLCLERHQAGAPCSPLSELFSKRFFWGNLSRAPESVHSTKLHSRQDSSLCDALRAANETE